MKIKSIPYIPISHPLVERLTGTIRRETLTAPSFGMRRIWKENSADSHSITTIAVFISRWMGALLLKLVADINHYPQN